MFYRESVNTNLSYMYLCNQYISFTSVRSFFRSFIHEYFLFVFAHSFLVYTFSPIFLIWAKNLMAGHKRLFTFRDVACANEHSLAKSQNIIRHEYKNKLVSVRNSLSFQQWSLTGRNLESFPNAKLSMYLRKSVLKLKP